MGKIEQLRDAWQTGDRSLASRVVEVAECPAPPAKANIGPCLDAAARAFGSPGFSVEPPDQASAAAVAFVLARRESGEGIPSPDTWLQAVAAAHGAGADALRLALASTMAEATPLVGRLVNEEPAVRAMLGGVARAVPGACDTYGALGRGDPLTSFAPAASPDHSPCVQHDLERKDGAGAAYGDGIWRAASAGATLWKEAAQALEIGIAITQGGVRRELRKKLDAIEPATLGLYVRPVTTTQTGQYHAEDGHEAHAVPSVARPPSAVPSAPPSTRPSEAP